MLFFSAMVSTRSSVSNADAAHANNANADNHAKANADDANDANANDADAADKADDKKPDVNRKVWGKRPPDTDATLPLPTSELARQADDYRLLAEMELELLKRGTE